MSERTQESKQERKLNLGIRVTPESRRALKILAANRATSVQAIFDDVIASLIAEGQTNGKSKRKAA